MKWEFLRILLFLSRKKNQDYFFDCVKYDFSFFFSAEMGFFVLDWVIFFSAQLIFNKTPKNKVQRENSLYSMHVKKIYWQNCFSTYVWNQVKSFGCRIKFSLGRIHFFVLFLQNTFQTFLLEFFFNKITLKKWFSS